MKSASNCANCGKKFTCNCQKTIAQNGQTVCKSCKNKYNSKKIMVKNGNNVRNRKRQLQNTINRAQRTLNRS